MDALLAPLIGAGSPFELQESSGAGLPVFRHAPATLRALYARAQARSAGSVIVVCGDEQVTQQALFARANALGAWLRSGFMGGAPARIGVLLPNSPAWMVAFVAVTSVGATAVLIPHDADAASVASSIEIAGCALILTDEATASRLAHRMDCAVHVLSGSEVASSALSGEVTPSPDHEALIAFTSGSTGQPKGVVLTHRNLITGLWNMMLGGAWAARRTAASSVPRSPRAPVAPRNLLVSPLSHISGYSQFLLMLAVSGRIVLLQEWDAVHAVRLIREQNITALVGATAAMTREVLRLGGENREPLPLESFSIHGAALRRGLMEEILAACPAARVTTGYGMTETSGSIAIATGTEILERPATCGPALPTAQIQIRDPAGEPAPVASAGEIWVRGSMVTRGYCGSSASTAGVSIDGWLRTGDIGLLDEQRYLSVLERSRDSFHVGARRVFCSEVEALLDQWQLGDEAIALGTDSGRRLLIVIMPREGEVVAADAIQRRIGEALRVPEELMSVVCRQRVPRTSSGKVDRLALRELSAADSESEGRPR